jgi:hypothetical protein
MTASAMNTMVILTAGMEFGRKAVLLRNLVYRTDHPNKATILHALGRLQNNSKRNVFAHSFLTADSNEIMFIDRSRGGDYSVTTHTFTIQQWTDHVIGMAKDAGELEDGLQLGEGELHEFALAAINTDSKSARSPTPPNSSTE